MKKFLTFMLLLWAVPALFALSDKDLAHKAAQVQRKFGLIDWTVTVRFVTFREMVIKNQCKCFGQSLLFPKTKTAVVDILDDEGYKILGWKGSMTLVHQNELFATLHELLHIFVEREHPEFDDDMEELAVRQLARMVEHQPEVEVSAEKSE